MQELFEHLVLLVIVELYFVRVAKINREILLDELNYDKFLIFLNDVSF